MTRLPASSFGIDSNSVTGDGVQVAVIPAGNWQAAHCLGEYMLAGCTVAPGYENQDFRWVREIARAPAALHR